MKRLIFIIFFLYSCSQSPEYYLKRGNYFFVSGDYYKAIDMYTRALIEKHDYSDAYLSRALAYEKISNKIKAVDDYMQAIKYNPKNTAAYNNIASLYIESGFYDKALYYVNKAIEIDPSYRYGYYNRGLVYYYTSQYSKSVVDFTKAIELSSNKMPLAIYYRAVAYYKLGMLKDAINDIDYLINTSNTNDVIYYTKAKIMYDISPSQAIYFIDRAIEIKQDPQYYYLRAVINEKLSKIDDAINDINNAIKLSNFTKASYLYYASDLYLKLKDTDSALKYCDMALKVDENTKDEYDRRIKNINKFIGKKYRIK